MKTINLLTIPIILTALMGAAWANDVDDVRATIERHYAAIHANDMETIRGHHLDDFTMFLSNGGVLFDPDWAEVSERMGATIDFGTLNVRMSSFNAQIYGNIAVATFYLVGTRTQREKTQDITWRVSAVWVKQGREWKEAHHHESPLRTGGHR